MADLLFEIGAEELPAGFVPAAVEQLQRDLLKALDDARLGHGEVKAVGSPRRLAVWAREVAPKQAPATPNAEPSARTSASRGARGWTSPPSSAR